MLASVVLLLLLLLASRAHADTSVPQPVVGYRVTGNTKLTERTLGYLVHVGLGALTSDADLAEMDQALHSSELFETIEVSLEEVHGGVVIVAKLEDKHSWIVAPTLFLLPGNKAFGVGYAENNLGGEDVKLLLYGQIGTKTSLGFGTYLDPAVRGSNVVFRADIYMLHKLIDEYTNDPGMPRSHDIARTTGFTFLDAGLLVGWTFHWWLVADFRLRGAYQYFRDAHANDTAMTPLPVPQQDGWDITAQARITLDARHHHYGVTWGPYLQLQTEQSVPGLDSYGFSDMLARAYYSWTLFCEHELEVRGAFSAGYHMPFNEELALGGQSDLRGYSVDQFRGDVRASFRAEYSVPITKWRILTFRGIGFWDSGYVGYHFQRADRDYLPTQHDGAHWTRNDIGAGLRIYVSNIVLPLLGLDFGYGLEGHSPEVYFEIGLTDF